MECRVPLDRVTTGSDFTLISPSYDMYFSCTVLSWWEYGPVKNNVKECGYKIHVNCIMTKTKMHITWCRKWLSDIIVVSWDVMTCKRFPHFRIAGQLCRTSIGDHMISLTMGQWCVASIFSLMLNRQSNNRWFKTSTPPCDVTVKCWLVGTVIRLSTTANMHAMRWVVFGIQFRDHNDFSVVYLKHQCQCVCYRMSIWITIQTSNFQ